MDRSKKQEKMIVSVIVPVYKPDPETYDQLRLYLDMQDLGLTDIKLEVIYEIDREGRGAGPTRNQAIAKARGELLLFTDADCIPPLDWVNTMADAAKANPDVDVFGGGVADQDWLAAAIGDAQPTILRDGSLYVAGTYNCAIRRKALEREVGFTSFRVGQDTELMLRLRRAGCKFKYVDSVVKHYPKRSFWQYLKRRYMKGQAHTRDLVKYWDVVPDEVREGYSNGKILFVLATVFPPILLLIALKYVVRARDVRAAAAMVPWWVTRLGSITYHGRD